MPEAYVEPMTESLVSGVSSVRCFKCLKLVTVSKCGGCHAIGYCGRECQKADRPRHKWNCLPVMVTEFPGKGRGLVAARDIKMGELIFKDKPTFKVTLDNFGLPDLDSLKKQIEKLPIEAQRQFYKLEPTKDSTISCLINGNGSKELKILMNNGCDHGDEWLLHLNVALLNHSCAPNAFVGSLMPLESKNLEVRAVKDISRGEEVTICYLLDGQNIGSMAQRRTLLRLEHAISDCKCGVCSGDIPDPEALVLEFQRIFGFLKSFGYDNLYQKKLSHWKKEAKVIEKVLDFFPQMYITTVEDKYRAYECVAEFAQMARDPVLLEKAMTTWKKLAEDTKLEQVTREHENMKEKLAQWSAQFKSSKPPKKAEIDFFELHLRN